MGDSIATERSALLEHTMVAAKPSPSDYTEVEVRTVDTTQTVIVVVMV